MNQKTIFIRKIVYVGAIVALLFPLFLLGQPATRSVAESEPGMDAQATGVVSSAGGKLAQLRAGYGLSQAGLGEIDPASETMKMATLGLRGVATNLLWTKANRYKRTESWDKLSATLNQITKLQPNYISVWEFEAHNLSYNVSAEFDNYRDRYYKVKEGIEFLIKGARLNRRSPRLFWNLGWFVGQKIGRADEHKQFRRLYRTDTVFHDAMYPDVNIEQAIDSAYKRPDNWLTAYLWYKKSQAVADEGIPVTWMRLDPNKAGLTDKRRSSVLFYSDPAMAKIDHAAAVTEEITPDEKTQYAWKIAGGEWDDFGSKDIPTTAGFTIRLKNLDAARKEVDQWRAKLETLAPGLREKVRDERRKALSPEELAVDQNRSKPFNELSSAEIDLIHVVNQKLTVTDRDLAEAVPDDLRTEARYYAARTAEAIANANRIGSYSVVVNYPYWEVRCAVEAEPVTISARRFMMLGEQQAEEANPEEARRYYEKAWDEWAKIFEKHPPLIHDEMADDLKDPIEHYKQVLDQMSEEFPEDFKLNILLTKDKEPMRLQSVAPPGDPKNTSPPTVDKKESAATAKPTKQSSGSAKKRPSDGAKKPQKSDQKASPSASAKKS